MSLWEVMESKEEETDLQATVTNARDFETAKLKANHIQAVNLVMNGSSELDSKLKQFNTLSNNLETNQKSLTSNILPATITKNELLAAIFLFKIKELLETSLFSRAAFKEKPIIVMYTDAKINGHSIKLILDSGSADSIITRQFINRLGCQVD
ncbi:hypothetical protein G9A89_015527 [Geosiphon pyriformis]|nr:hypothetical protein G9A89_015527 [Geosiphon pyriformis]